MEESCEFRIQEDYAELLFGPNEGEKLDRLTRKVIVSTNDARFPKIGTLQSRLNQDGKYFFSSWRYLRRYSSEEIKNAEALLLIFTSFFEPPGEDCGTIYDDSVACVKCGSGAAQRSDLFLDLRKLPKRREIASTIAGEWVVSQRLGEIFDEAGISGVTLAPTHHKAFYEDEPVDLATVPSGRLLIEEAARLGLSRQSWKYTIWLNRPAQRALWETAVLENAERLGRRNAVRKRQWPVWYQLSINARPVPVARPTRFGIHPFNEDVEGKYRCPLGHIPGLALLSELYVSKSLWDRSDFFCTREFVGIRRGALRPRPLIIVSPRVRSLFIENRIMGVAFELVHLV